MEDLKRYPYGDVIIYIIKKMPITDHIVPLSISLLSSYYSNAFSSKEKEVDCLINLFLDLYITE